MTFAQVCKQHQAGKNLDFTHPDLRGIYTFDKDGHMTYMVNGLPCRDMPIWLSDFDRDDWHIISGG